jgi:hypothetical protein
MDVRIRPAALHRQRGHCSSGGHRQTRADAPTLHHLNADWDPDADALRNHLARKAGTLASRRGTGEELDDRVRGLGRAEPLAGCVFVALLVASFVVGGSPPGASASTAKVVGFWRDHRDAQITAAVLAGFAAIVLVWFGAVVRAKLRDAEGEPGRIAAAAFGGFLLIAAGGLAIAGFQFTAADTAASVPATVTQALAALNRDFFFLLDGGVLIAVSATAAATLWHAAFPRWYGYLSIAVGFIFLTPTFAVAFPAFGLWTLLLSLLTFRADSPSIRRSPAPLR